MKNIKSMIYTAVFASLIAVCAIISVPTVPPFTMQTFAVFLSIYTLGKKRAFAAIVVYTAIGLLGVPVFASFSAGFGVLFGPNGGFLCGFLLMPPVYAIAERTGKTVLASVVSLLVCYGFGTVWFMNIYGYEFNLVGIVAAVQVCVLPFILPDLIKAALAYSVAKRIRPAINL